MTLWIDSLLMGHVGENDFSRRRQKDHSIEVVFEAVADGVRTVDLRGRTTTSGFADHVIRRVWTKLAF